MVFIFGGAYQGKLDYALDNYGKTLSVYQCSECTYIDFAKDIINSYHMLVLAQVKSGIDAYGFLAGNMDMFKNKIIIMDEIGSGIVPVSAEARAWREAAGRCAALFTERSDDVIRIFCGLGMRLK